MQYDVDMEIAHLVSFIKRLGKVSERSGRYKVKYGTLFADNTCQQTLESLAGTLKAAKKRKIIKYKPEVMLQGVSDNEYISLLKPEFGQDKVKKDH